MMNPDKHRFTKSQVRLHVYTRHWEPSGRAGVTFKDHEVLRRHPRPQQLHPTYRRRRRKHPAYYNIRYIRSRKISIHRLAWFRYHKTEAEREFSMQGRCGQHPVLQTE